MLNVSPLLFSHLSIRFRGAIIVPILQMKCLEHKEVKKPDGDYVANTRQAEILTLGLLLLTTGIYCLVTRHQVHEGMVPICLHSFRIQEFLAHTIFHYIFE